MVCDLSVWMNRPIPLELDHIDGNSDNNAAANLRIICCNCHAQTPTYKGKNKGRTGLRGKLRTAKLKEVALKGVEPLLAE